MWTAWTRSTTAESITPSSKAGSDSADYIDGNLAPGEHGYEWLDITLDELAAQLIPTYVRHPLGRYDFLSGDDTGEVQNNFDNLENDALYKLQLIKTSGNKDLAEKLYTEEIVKRRYSLEGEDTTVSLYAIEAQVDGLGEFLGSS